MKQILRQLPCGYIDYDGDDDDDFDGEELPWVKVNMANVISNANVPLKRIGSNVKLKMRPAHGTIKTTA